MNSDRAVALLDRLHEARNAFYGSGSGAPLERRGRPAFNAIWSG